MKKYIIGIIILLAGLMPSFASEQDSGYYQVHRYTYSNSSRDGEVYLDGDCAEAVLDLIILTDHRLVWSIQALDGMFFCDNPRTLLFDQTQGIYYTESMDLLIAEDLSYLNVINEDGVTHVYGKTSDYVVSEDMLTTYIEDPDFGGETAGYSLWTYILYFFLALLPGIVLFAFIYWRDRLRPEPVKELLLAFFLGVLTVIPIILAETWVIKLGVYGATSSVFEGFKEAFIGAAIPEEFFKLAALILLFRWRKHQNEFMDGIVYAACIGLGFALAENVKYVIGNLLESGTGEALVSVVVNRALVSVPMHFGLAVIMGYFFSYYLFIPVRRWLSLLLAFVVPVVFHGLYDMFLMILGLNENWIFILFFLVFAVFFYLNQLGVKAIRAALKMDNNILKKN